MEDLSHNNIHYCVLITLHPHLDPNRPSCLIAPLTFTNYGGYHLRCGIVKSKCSKTITKRLSYHEGIDVVSVS